MSVTLAYVGKGDTVVDATCGSGQDTVVLSRAVGESGQVYAFDIQKKALLLTETRLHAHGCGNVHLLMKSFAEMGEHIPASSAAAVVFNLGYLPGGDHGKATKAQSSIRAIQTGLGLLKKKGMMTVCIYSGGDSGFEEKEAVLV
jgi:methylase of polypeptide subunit release factors